MGNICFKLMTNRQKKSKLRAHRSLMDLQIQECNYDQSLGSISNLTISDESLRRHSITEKSGTLTPSRSSPYTFSWSRIQALYLEYPPSKDLKLNIELIKSIFEIIITDEINNAKRIQESIELVDADFSSRFESYMRNKPDMPLPTAIIKHTLSMFHLHLKITTLLLDYNNKTKALEIIKLIAISHLLMKVPPSEFRLLDMVFGKYLLCNNFVDIGEFHMIIIYMNTVTKLVTEHMGLASKLPFVHEKTTYTPRDNYRMMKKWRKLLQSMDVHYDKEKLVELVTQVPSYDAMYDTSTIATEELKRQDPIMKFLTHFKTRNK